MSIWASNCSVVSRATLTMISTLVAPNMLVTCSEFSTMVGMMAMMARNREPNRVRRLLILPRYSPVGRPARMPGMKPPFCCRRR